MKLTDLHITNLRNINTARLNVHSFLNVISGHNGSGKTSFIEALYLLGSGHSFRTREISSLVSHQQETLTVFAKTDDHQQISIQKSIQQPARAFLNSAPCFTSSQLASFLPSQVFYQDIFQIIDAGPSIRRGLLDWVMFHVEHSYHDLWKDYRRVLKQRNNLLKQRATEHQLTPWSTLLVKLASQLDALRVLHFNRLADEFNAIILQLTDFNCALQYYRGWDKKNEGKSLDAILQATYQGDCQRQYTQYGAHHADLFVTSKDFKVKHFLSRGQQKILLFALKFALAKLVHDSCIFLIDDLCSELDEQHIKRVMQYITKTNGQFFITMRETDLHLLTLFPTQNQYTHYSVNNGIFNKNI